MPEDKPLVGTTIIAPAPVGEGFIEISPRKTLIVQRFTNEEAAMPEFVSGLETIDDVFKIHKPSCEVELETEEGSVVREDFRFNTLGDFGIEKLINQSPFLKKLDSEDKAYSDIARKGNKDKRLKIVMEDPEKKTALLELFQQMIDEIDKY